MIQTVKLQGSGYLLNGIMHVPKADGNSEYELIKQWLSEGNTPEPEFTEAELAEQTKQSRIAELKHLLASTDYKDLPNYQPKEGESKEAIIAERNAWRNEIRELEVLTK